MTELEAEICFQTPEEMRAMSSILVEHGFQNRVLDWTDPCGGDHVWILAKIVTELTPEALLDQVCALVGDRGFVVEAGPVRTDEQLEQA